MFGSEIKELQRLVICGILFTFNIMTGSHYINHLDQQIELKYFNSEPFQLKGRLGMRIWIDVNESIVNFEKKIRKCKTIEELYKLFK